jgi:hypothetical protein
MMQRRQLISLIGGAAVYPLAVKAQARTRYVGVLTGNVEADRDAQARVRAFKEGLYARRDEGDNSLRFEIRWPGPDVGSAGRRRADRVKVDHAYSSNTGIVAA